MKKVHILLLGLVFTILAACSESKEDQIMKTWSLGGVSAEVLFQFGEEGAFSLQSQNLDGTVSKNTGKWRFAEGKEVVLIDLKGDEQAFKVVELKENKLILLPAGMKDKMEFKVKS